MKVAKLAMEGTLPADIRRRAASALMHPATLAALGVLLVNDLLFKVLWPEAWVPGKLSDLAWMVFAPPVLAYILSFAPLGNGQRQGVGFAVAYAGLPLLYAAFNTFQPVHDAILLVLGSVGGDGPRSPLDPTDSLVIPLGMAAALWIWCRPPLEGESIRARLALLAAATAALASVATSYDTDWGITQVGRTTSGTMGANTDASSSPGFDGSYESVDGGLTWARTSKGSAPLERQAWSEQEVRMPSGAYFTVDGPNIVRAYKGSRSQEVVYSYGHLQSDGNRWMQALDKRDNQENNNQGA